LFVPEKETVRLKRARRGRNGKRLDIFEALGEEFWAVTPWSWVLKRIKSCLGMMAET
jgi:hypothetical protein